jgi:hypothetical protein
MKGDRPLDATEAFLATLGPAGRADLLRVLSPTSRVRADVIRQFWDRAGGPDMAELLMELEANELLRERSVLVLERMTHEDEAH